MNDYNSSSSASLSERHISVQRLLGTCVLKLQEFELLLKRVLPYAAVSGQPADLSASLAATSASLRTKMMGSLVGTLTETFIASNTDDSEDIDIQPNVSNTTWVEHRTQIVLDAERHREVTKTLKELVTLRNELVHHFIDKYDLSSPEGCAHAEVFLQHSYKNIEEHLSMLRGWTKALASAHTMMASVLSDSTFQDFINGVASDGSVDWPRSGIVQGLRDAEEQLAMRGWTRLNDAVAWMVKNAPTHTPKRYNCTSWRQVLHESKQFELRREAPAELGLDTTHIPTAWYRSRRPHPSS